MSSLVRLVQTQFLVDQKTSQVVILCLRHTRTEPCDKQGRKPVIIEWLVEVLKPLVEVQASQLPFETKSWALPDRSWSECWRTSNVWLTLPTAAHHDL